YHLYRPQGRRVVVGYQQEDGRVGNGLSRRERRPGTRADESLQNDCAGGEFPDRLRPRRQQMYAAHGVGKHPRQRRDYKVETGLVPSPGAILETDAADAALPLELHPWPPDCPLAQSLSSMAD